MSFQGSMRALVVLFLFNSISPAQTGFEEIAANARVAREANEVPKAIELYRSALKLRPDWPEGLFWLGSLLYDSDQFSAAEGVLGRFVEINPSPGPALGLLGLCEFETGDYSKALKHIQGAPQRDDQMGAVLRFHEAQLLTKDGNYDKAVQLFSSFLQGADAPAALLVPLGIAALRQSLMAKDVSATQQEFYTAAGRTAAAILSGDSAASQNRLSDLVARYPNSAGVHGMKAFYLLSQDPAGAMDEFRQELKIDGSNASANAMLSWMLLNEREPEAALPYAKRAIAAAPEYAPAQYAYGRALSELTDVQQGISYLEKAVKAEPENLEAHLALTSAYSKAGRTDDARNERQRCLQIAREVAAVFIR